MLKVTVSMKEYDRREMGGGGGGHFHSKVIGMLVISFRV